LTNINLSEEELAEYSKHKTQHMYSKYGSYRALMGLIVMFGAGALFMRNFKNTTKTLSNSVLIHETEQQFFKHRKVKDLLLQLNKNNSEVKWKSNLVGGGQSGNNFDCVVNVDGIKGGKVFLGGTFKEKKENYEISKMLFQYKKNN